MGQDHWNENEQQQQWNTTGQAREVNGDEWRAQQSQTYRMKGCGTSNEEYSRFYTNGTNAQAGGGNRESRRAEKKRMRAERKQNGNEDVRRRGFAVTVGKCAVCAVIFGLVSGGVFLGLNQNTIVKNTNTTGVSSNAALDAAEGSIGDVVMHADEKVDKAATSTAVTVTDVSDIVKNAMPSIVSITNMSEMEYRDWWGQTYMDESESCGSGVIISQDDQNLYIATNNHVVEGATTITVSFIDDSTATAEVKGTDSSMDLAVVSIPLEKLSEETLSAIKVATLGDSTELEVGEGAIAIGNALGYGQSVTTGCISAIDREVTLTDETMGKNITNELIQTDAAINPGNSGGALLNMKGEVIGINSAKFASSTIEGMGFAIPVSTAQPILDDLITRELVDEADSAYLGISGVDVTEEVAESYNMPEGIYIAKIYEGTAAEEGGLMKGDIITSFDNHTVNSMESLTELLQYYSAGTQVDIVIKRASNGEYEEQTLSITLGSKN